MRTATQPFALHARRFIACRVLALGLVGCSIEPANSSSGLNKTPGAPFLENVCFQCTLHACSIALNACARETGCTNWFDCISACPTDSSGVAAEGKCLRACGLPVSANVLFECIQDFSTGTLLGCERACVAP
jgi:hypothetical protein